MTITAATLDLIAAAAAAVNAGDDEETLEIVTTETIDVLTAAKDAMPELADALDMAITSLTSVLDAMPDDEADEPADDEGAEAMKGAADGVRLRDAAGKLRTFDMATFDVDVERDGRHVRLAIATTGREDRYGDIVETQTLDLTNWIAQGAPLTAHHDRRVIIGRALNPQKQEITCPDGQVRLAVTFEPSFDMNDDNPEAKRLARQYAEGIVRCWSIEFMPHPVRSIWRGALPKEDPAYAERGILWRDAEMLLNSLVIVPANVDAAQVPGKAATGEERSAEPEFDWGAAPDADAFDWGA